VSNSGRNWHVRVPDIMLTRPGAAQEEHIGILASSAVGGGDDKRVRGSGLGPVAPIFESQIITCVCVEVNFMLGTGLDWSEADFPHSDEKRCPVI